MIYSHRYYFLSNFGEQFSRLLNNFHPVYNTHTTLCNYAICFYRVHETQAKCKSWLSPPDSFLRDERTAGKVSVAKIFTFKHYAFRIINGIIVIEKRGQREGGGREEERERLLSFQDKSSKNTKIKEKRKSNIQITKERERREESRKAVASLVLISLRSMYRLIAR